MSSRAIQKEKLRDHVRELRRRFVVSIIFLFVASSGIYFVYVPILNLLRAPLGQSLYYDTPYGSLAFVMKLCVIGGLLVAMPVLAYNIIMFIRPAFKKAMSAKRIVFVSSAAGFLAFCGAAFGYFVILEDSLRFFSSLQVSGLHALISADSYQNFVTNVILTFVLMFQMPLVVGFINRIKPIKPGTMMKGEKWALLASLAVGAVVPFSYDIVTSLLIGLPIFVLYNVSFIYILILELRSVRRPAPVAAAAPAEEYTEEFEPDIDEQFAAPSQLEYALEPLDWLVEEEISPPAFHDSPNIQKGGTMDVNSKRPVASQVQPPEWYIRRQEKLRLAQTSNINKIPPGTRLVSI